jgi:hypothetical protein
VQRRDVVLGVAVAEAVAVEVEVFEGAAVVEDVRVGA